MCIPHRWLSFLLTVNKKCPFFESHLNVRPYRIEMVFTLAPMYLCQHVPFNRMKAPYVSSDDLIKVDNFEEVASRAYHTERNMQAPFGKQPQKKKHESCFWKELSAFIARKGDS